MTAFRWILVAVVLAPSLGLAQPTPVPEAGEASAVALAPAPPMPAGELDPAHAFVTANAAYEDGDWDRAVELYSALVAAGHDSGEVRYNLGNALLRAGELGRAVASYRRAAVERPRDQDLAANLAFARQAAKDAIAPPAPPAIQRILFFWHYSLSPGEVAVTAVVANLLLWTVLAVRLRYRRSETLRWVALGLALVVVATVGSVLTHRLAPMRVAVVVPAEVDAHTGPSTDTVVRFKLHAGTEVRVRDHRDGWLRVALPDGQQGWLQRDGVEVVEG